MIKKLHLYERSTATQVLHLQKKAYRVEADLIGFEEIPPLMETLETLMASDEIFWGYFDETLLKGFVSYKIQEGVLDIHRVCVDPTVFRSGIAKQLITFIETHDPSINKIVVSTGQLNMPAIKLYVQLGYQHKEDIEVAPDFYISSFEKYPTLK